MNATGRTEMFQQMEATLKRIEKAVKENGNFTHSLGDRLTRIESKLDFMLRQSARKESVPLAPTAYSALAQAGMDPRQLQTHKVVTLLDDWEAEQKRPQVEIDHASTTVPSTCPGCYKEGALLPDSEEKNLYRCSECGVEFRSLPFKKKEDGDEQG